MSEARAADVADSIRRNEALAAELRYWMSSMPVAAIIAGQRIDVASKLRDAVDKKIGA